MKFARWHPWTGIAVAACIALAGCEKSADTSIADARTLLDRGEAAAAVIVLKNALQAHPNRAEARLLLGRALLARHDPAAAAVELTKASELGAAADDVVPLLADAWLHAGQPAKVIALDQESKLVAPAAVAALKTAAASAHMVANDAAAAERAVGAALQAQPGHAPARLVRARLLWLGGDIEAALKVADEVLKAGADDADALVLKGDLLRARGADGGDAAADLYRKALAARPDHLDAHAGLLTVLLDRNEVEPARAALDALRQARPGHFQARYFEARWLAQSRQLKPAYEKIQQLLKVAPSHRAVLQLAAAVELQLGESVQAEKRLEALLQRQPASAAVRRMLARARLNRGDAAGALAVIEPLLAADGADAQTLLIAGSAHLVAGDAKLAQALFSRAAARQPDDLAARAALAISKVAAGDVAGGLPELEAVAAQDSGTTADQALISAYVGSKQFDKALEAADRLRQKQPGRPLPLQLRANLLALKGDLKAARAGYEQVLAADPAYFAAVEALVALDVREKKPEQAHARLARLLEANPGNVQALLSRAALNERLGVPRREVAVDLERAIALKPADPGLRQRLIRYQMVKQDYKAAADAAKAALLALPADADLLQLLAVTQLASGDATQAVQTYGKLVSARPQAPEVLVGLAEAQLAAGSPDAAAATAERALALAPASVPALQTAVKIDLQAGRHDRALARARALQRSMPSAPLGWVVEGDVEQARGRWRPAETAYRTALQKQEASPVAQRLHVALRNGGDKARMESFAADWLQRHPKDTAFLEYLASWAIVDKKLDLAATHLERVLAIAPDTASALNNLAWVRAKLGRPGAVDAANRANELSPNQPVYLDTLAFALAAEGKVARAVRVQQVALELAPQAHGLRLNLARLYLRAGDRTAAREELETLARLGKAFAQQDEVRALRAKL